MGFTGAIPSGDTTMNTRVLFFLFVFSLPATALQAQDCTALGQNPGTAFPVCGTSVFSQSVVPVCGIHTIPVACNDGASYMDKNPFWYKFTCFTSGTLGFVITPNDLRDDYDWQLFDITGHSPDEVYTNTALFVGANWSGETGKTGASSAGNTSLVCATTTGSPYRPLFSTMPVLEKGHNYLLLISHFSGVSQSGYQLSFGGGTASITDTLPPKMLRADAYCDGTRINLKLNKKMKCSSLATDGSDFALSPAIAAVSGAVGVNCNSGFDMDSVVISLNRPLPPGNYSIVIRNGTDGNTLLDNCDREVPVGDTVPFTVFPQQPTPMDSMVPVTCAPAMIQLVFRKPMLCSSIAADGSDFKVTGPYPVTVAGAAGNCSNGLSSTIQVKLTSPLVHAGTYQVRLVIGTDGNTVLDECGEQTPAGSALSFTIKDTVSAVFSYREFQGCRQDSISFSHDGRNAVDQWLWTFDHSFTSTAQDTSVVYTGFSQKIVWLKVSNGFCSDSADVTLFPDTSYEVHSAFEVPEFLCPNDLAAFKDLSTGNIVSWNWDFGDGAGSTLETPPLQRYPVMNRDIDYPVRLIVTNRHDCMDTAVHSIKSLYNCYIAVPTAFTPNGDGINDFLYPLNAWKADNLDFRVYNRYGQLVFETRDWTTKWDGKINGIPQPTGSYVWILQYTDRDTGQKHFMKGASLLIR